MINQNANFVLFKHNEGSLRIAGLEKRQSVFVHTRAPHTSLSNLIGGAI